MSYKKYLLIISAIALGGWLSLVLVILKMDPCTGPGQITICHSVSSLSLMAFFFSAFFTLTATFTLFGFAMRLWFNSYEIYFDHLTISLRQGILLSFCALGSMGLLLLNSLTWWSGLLLIAIVLLLEMYFAKGI